MDLFGISDHDSDNVEDVLERLDSYIIALAEEIVFCSSNFAHHDVLDLEIDEIAQNVRIKFWRASQEKHIMYQQAYIKRMVHNEFIDHIRRRKPLLPLPIDEDGEIYHGKLMVTPSEGMTDPADEFEQEEAVAEEMAQVAFAISKLPPRQQLAMTCSLKERVDDSLRIINALKLHLPDVESAHWPDDEIDAQRLKASLSAARRAIAQNL